LSVATASIFVSAGYYLLNKKLSATKSQALTAKSQPHDLAETKINAEIIYLEICSSGI
ncbi:MAG: hypothetical protein GY751_01965, partial [Bacteroidetes bacterium]|nr:hypothetical protein [Bacteroidota bacterium]